MTRLLPARMNRILWGLLISGICGWNSASGQAPSPLKVQEFVFESAPFKSCHASTLVETGAGDLLCAWFAGDAEGRTNVSIWLSRKTPAGWSTPSELVTGVQPDGTRYPCWNPVLTRSPEGVIELFYKVGPKPDRWWGMHMVSSDDGLTWSRSRPLPPHVLGPIKNKPEWFQDGRLLAPSSDESPVTDTWVIRMESRIPSGEWTTTGPIADPEQTHPIQPSILKLSDGRLQILCRSRSGSIVQSFSPDGGQTWSPIEKSKLPNPNAGTDALTLASGIHILIYNPTTKGRTPLELATSRDGLVWTSLAVLESEPGEYSYPTVIQTRSGEIHGTYTWKRQRIRHYIIPSQQVK